MSSQKNRHSNGQDIYDECKYYYNKIGQDTSINDDYNYSAGDYSEDIDTDLETATSIDQSQYIKIHQNLNPIEPHEISTQNPSVSKKFIKGINLERQYLPNHTTIVTSSQPPQSLPVTEIYRRHCKKNKVTATIMPQQQTQRSPILMLSGAPTNILNQNLQPQYCQQQPHLVLQCLPTCEENEQQIYVTNNSRNYSCRYCATELIVPIKNQLHQQSSKKRHIHHCVAADTAEPLINYCEGGLVDEYSDGFDYDVSPRDLIPTTYHQQQYRSHYHQYPHSSPQLQEMRDIRRSVNTVTNGATTDVNSTRKVLQAPTMSSNTGTFKSTTRGSTSINDGINNQFCHNNDAVDSYTPSRLQNINGNSNIQHRFKPSREYTCTHAPIPVSGNGNNTDHIPSSMRSHTTQGDVIQRSQVHCHVTPHPSSHRQRHRTTVLAPRYYKRISNGGGTALYKPPSKLCLPVFSQPEYPSFITTTQRKHRMHNTTSSRHNRTLQHQYVGETMEGTKHRERVEFESTPPCYTEPDVSYKVIQKERFLPHPKRKLKNKLLTLIDSKRESNNTPSCEMESLLAHFENLFDTKEKDNVTESSKEIAKDMDKSIPPSIKSVKYTPSQASLRRSRLSSLLLKSKQDNKKNLTKLKKCGSTTSQQTIVLKTRLKNRHDKMNTPKTNPSKINNCINDNKINDNDNIDSNKNMIDDITLTLNNKTTSTPKEVLSSLVDDQQLHIQPQQPFSNDINSNSLDNLLADLMASGYINQQQHDKSKSINQKMRQEAQRMLNTQSVYCSSPNTSKKRLIDSSSHQNQMLDKEGDNNSITNSCIGSTDNTSDGEIAISINSKTNNTTITTTHNIINDDNGDTNAGGNDDHGIYKTVIGAATTSMQMLSTSNNENHHVINNNTTSSTNADDTKNNLTTKNNLINTSENIESPNLSFFKSDKTKSYSHISSQTNNNEAKENVKLLTKSIKSNLKSETDSSKLNISQLNAPLKSSTSVNHHNAHYDEDRTISLELHQSKSYIIKLIDRALSKELGTAPELRLTTIESPSTTNRHRSLLNTNMFENKEKTANISQLVTNTEICSATVDSNVEISNESKPSTSSFKMHTEEASCLKKLKMLRWSHLKHIQEEVQCLQDLERFLESCNENNPK